MLTGLNHVGFTVSSLDRAVAFWTAVLGTGPWLRDVWEGEAMEGALGYPGIRMEGAFFHMPGGGVYLELIQYLHPAWARVDMETFNVGNGHVCLETDDIDAEVARLVSLGATARSERPVDLLTGPNAGGRLAFVRDADGISIELLQPPAGRPIRTQPGA